MTPWLLSILALVPAIAVPVAVACRGGSFNRLVAVQLASSVAGMMLALMTFAFDQSSFIDLPLCLALLSLPSTLLFALFLERWL